jgi:dihydrofolate reductase
MRRLIVSIHSTANDIVTGPPSDETNFMVWAQAGIDDSHSLESFLKSLATVDTILLGRATYEDLVRKWPKVKEWPQVSDVVLRIGEKINATPKVVVTSKHPLESLEWGEFEPPTKLTGPSIEEQIKGLKEGDGGDIITFGSPTLVQSLTNARLVDEYRILIHPVIVNEGKRLFERLEGRTDFRLISVDTFERGAILITYAPILRVGQMDPARVTPRRANPAPCNSRST